MEKYRGDTYIFSVGIEQDGQAQNFQEGDLVRLGAKRSTSDTVYGLYQEKTVDAETDTIEFVFSSVETAKLDIATYHLEIELTRNGNVETVYRDKLNVIGDVVNDKA